METAKFLPAMELVYSNGYALDILAFLQLSISSAYGSSQNMFGPFFPILPHTCLCRKLFYSEFGPEIVIGH